MGVDTLLEIGCEVTCLMLKISMDHLFPGLQSCNTKKFFRQELFHFTMDFWFMRANVTGHSWKSVWKAIHAPG